MTVGGNKERFPATNGSVGTSSGGAGMGHLPRGEEDEAGGDDGALPPGHYDVSVEVLPKPQIADPEGATIAGALAALGFDVATVRAGKVFKLRIAAASEEACRETAQEIAGKLLVNPVIEEGHISLESPE